MSSFRAAFIGAGSAARGFHYPSLARLDDVEIVAIADLNEALLAKTADEYGVAARYTDYRLMLAEQDIDAVWVIMPPMGLTPIALDVLAAGKNLFIEKPAGLTSADTRQMAAAAEAAGVITAVGCNRRYSAVLRRARELVEERGPISAAMAEFHKNMEATYYDLCILHTDIVHVVDALRWLLGEAVEVHSHADRWYRHAGWEHSYNHFNALIRFAEGGSGLLSANRQAGHRYEKFELHGADISAHVWAPNRAEIWRAGDSEPQVITGADLTGSEDPNDNYGYFTENREFIAAVRAGTQPQTCLADNVHTMELCDKIAAGAHVERT
jgi:virulence factor